MSTRITPARATITTMAVSLAALILMSPALLPADPGPGEIPSVIDYDNAIGYEGIASLGSSGFTAGPTPPVGDYVTTHCRYINVQNTTVGHYYLRYPLHLPDRALITNVSLFVADFNSTGVLWAYLRSRPWDSREGGTTRGFTLTNNTSDSDKLIQMSGLHVEVDNDENVYWVDVSPQNGLYPGQLCVYGIHVTYDCSSCDPLFADGFESGGTSAWSDAVP